MKILISGMNSLQTTENFYLRQQLNVVPTQYALLAALRDMGHTVDQRPVVIGESLDEYDKVIVFIHNPSGFAGYVYNALWAIHRRPDCILSLDDWQGDSIFDGVTKLTKESLFRAHVKDSHVLIPDDVEKYQPQFFEALDVIKAMKNKMLIAGFLGGDISLMLPQYPKELFRTYHLNPYHLNRTPENNFGETGPLFGDSSIEPSEKKKGWVFASLVQGRTRKYLKSLNLSGDWDVNFYGAARGEFKSPRLKEPQMCAEYQKYWGCIVPKYYHSGSGFWRPRVFQVADANSILVVDDSEGKLYSEAHTGCSPKDVEQMDLSQLIDLAKRQKEGLYDSQPLDKAITRRQLAEALDD